MAVIKFDLRILSQAIQVSLLPAFFALAIFFFDTLISSAFFLAAMLVLSENITVNGRSTFPTWLIFGLTLFSFHFLAGVFFIEKEYVLTGAVLFFLLCLTCSLPIVAAGLVFQHYSRQGEIVAASIFFSATLSLLDFFRSRILPGGSLAYSSSDDNGISAWLLSIGGEHFLVLTITLVSSLLAVLFLKKKFFKLFIVIAILFLVSISHIDSSPPSFDHSEPLNVHLVQIGISSEDKYKKQKEIRPLLISVLEGLPAQSNSGDDLIVFPESILVTTSEIESSNFLLDIKKAAKGRQVLYGELQMRPKNKSINRSVFVDRNGITHFYVKHGRVIFGEYIPEPIRLILEFLGVRQASIAKSDVVSRINPAGNIGVALALCYELSHSDIIRAQLYNNVPSLIASLSDYSWVNDIRISDFTRSAAKIRAAEYGIPLVQSGVDRATFFVSGGGKIISEAVASNSEVKIISSHVTPYPARTIYFTMGNFIFFFFVIILFFYGFALIESKGEHSF